MPMAPRHPCSYPGCAALLESGAGSRCQQHRTTPRGADAGKPFQSAVRTVDRTGERLYGSTRWRKARQTHLEHSPFCAQCGATATTVDHDPPHDGTPETFWDTATWVSLCAPCHNARSARWANQRRHLRQGMTAFAIPVTLVCGPPGSGKTAWVRERARWGDLTLDVDRLFEALSGLPPYEKPTTLLPLVAEARDAILSRLSQPCQVRHAWVITGSPDREDWERFRSRGAEVVVMAVEASECIRRISQDERRRDKWRLWEPLVRDWWQRYQAHATAVEGGNGHA